VVRPRNGLPVAERPAVRAKNRDPTRSHRDARGSSRDLSRRNLDPSRRNLDPSPGDRGSTPRDRVSNPRSRVSTLRNRDLSGEDRVPDLGDPVGCDGDRDSTEWKGDLTHRGHDCSREHRDPSHPLGRGRVGERVSEGEEWIDESERGPYEAEEHVAEAERCVYGA
jgi:hypothetical protein